MSGCILWDFHGTLGARSWADTLLEVHEQHAPDHPTTREQIAHGLQDGFPWHRHEQPHPELDDPADWWRSVGTLLQGAYRGVGHGDQRAKELAGLAAARYVDAAHYEVYDDTRPVLEALRDDGWRHWILSNHVPELESIVRGLGLRDLFEGVFTSATLGYEKPHPQLFAIAREQVGPAPSLVMVGDNIEADVMGAERVGIPAILVRKQDPRAKRRCDDLHGVAKILQTLTDA